MLFYLACYCLASILMKISRRSPMTFRLAPGTIIEPGTGGKRFPQDAAVSHGILEFAPAVASYPSWPYVGVQDRFAPMHGKLSCR